MWTGQPVDIIVNLMAQYTPEHHWSESTLTPSVFGQTVHCLGLRVLF